MQAVTAERSVCTKPWFQFHFCVLLWGCTAILGKVISLAAVPLVWWRMLIVALALLLMPRTWFGFKAMPARLFAIYLGIGALVALHWLAFYASVKLANASVAASTLALGPVLVAFIEPWIVRRRFDPRELLLGVAVIPGVVLVAGGTPPRMQLGLFFGLSSAAFLAVFAALNKRYAAHASSLSMTCLEMIGGLALVTALLPLLSSSTELLAAPEGRDVGLLLVFCLVCTLLPFALSLVALRQISAFGAQLALNLEPIYVIALGTLLLGEQHELSTQFYVGMAILLAAIFIYPMWTRRANT